MILKDCSAIVTGGSRGIGATIALKMAEQGADIAVIDISETDSTKQIIDKITKMGRRCEFYKTDISSFSETKIVIEKIIADFERIDILVNNAGINQDRVIWKMTEEQWDDVIAVNLKGYFNTIKHISPFFKEQKHGKIVNITSINGIRGKFGQTNYSASKAGIIGLTKSAAKDLGRFSINVNAVAPGFIITDMTDKLPDEIKEQSMKEIILNKAGTPEDVANAVLFLSSEMAGHITGEVLKVDGGQYM